MMKKVLGPNLTVANLWLVTAVSRAQSNSPLLVEMNGMLPKSGIAAGPGGRDCFLLVIKSHVRTSASRDTQIVNMVTRLVAMII